MCPAAIFNVSHCNSWWLLGSMVTSPISLPAPYELHTIPYHLRSYIYSQYFLDCEDSSSWFGDTSKTLWYLSSFKNPYPILYDHPIFDSLEVFDLDSDNPELIQSDCLSTHYSLYHRLTHCQSTGSHSTVCSSFQSCLYSYIERHLRYSLSRLFQVFPNTIPHLSCLDIVHSSTFTHDVTNWTIQFPLDYDLSVYTIPEYYPTWILGISCDLPTFGVLSLNKLLFYHSYQCHATLWNNTRLHCTLLGREGLFVCFTPSTHIPLKIHSVGLSYHRTSGSLFLIINSEIKLLLATDFFLWDCKFYPYFATLYPSGVNVPPPVASMLYSPNVSSLQTLCRSVIRTSIHTPSPLPSSFSTDVSPVLRNMISSYSSDFLHIDKLPLPTSIKSYLRFPPDY